jgi:hypothetical protein
LKSKFTSRKFLIAIVSVALQLLNGQLASPLTEDQMLQLSAIVVAYLVSQGWVDGKEKGNKVLVQDKYGNFERR